MKNQQIQSLFLIFAALSISFIGSLPFGVLNLTALYLSKNQGFLLSFHFSIGVALIELLFVILTLFCTKKINPSSIFFKFSQLIIGFFLLIIAIYMLFNSNQQLANTIRVQGNYNSFYLGISMSLFNLVQIPFWFSWNSYLIEKNILTLRTKSFFIYAVSAAFGTLIALSLFNYLGYLKSNFIEKNSLLIHYGIAVLFLSVAFFQIISGAKKIKFKKMKLIQTK